MKSNNLLVVATALIACFAPNLFAGLDDSLDTIREDIINISVEEIVGNVTYKFQGSVEYAVYAPGVYTGPVSMPADEYVYAYQASNSSDPASGLDINLFSIGLIPGSNADYDQAAYAAEPGEIVPMSILGNSQAIYFMYILDSVNPGQSSAVMIFSSPNAPVDGVGNLSIGTIDGVKLSLPTPVPEPVTLILLGAGCLPLRYFRKRPRRAA